MLEIELLCRTIGIINTFSNFYRKHYEQSLSEPVLYGVLGPISRRLAFGTPKFYIAPYGKVNCGLGNLTVT